MWTAVYTATWTESPRKLTALKDVCYDLKLVYVRDDGGDGDRYGDGDGDGDGVGDGDEWLPT